MFLFMALLWQLMFLLIVEHVRRIFFGHKQGDHSPDNVKFHDNSLTVPSTPDHVNCYSYYVGTSVIVSGSSAWSKTNMKCTSSVKWRMDVNLQLTINGFRQLFPDKVFPLTFPWLLVKSLTFPCQLSNSLTFPCFPDKWSHCISCTFLH